MGILGCAVTPNFADSSTATAKCCCRRRTGAVFTAKVQSGIHSEMRKISSFAHAWHKFFVHNPLVELLLELLN